MLRAMVHIDEEKCDGCGDCVPSCAEGAIKIIDGKARLLDDKLCDGLGACLGHCPQGAITVEERDATPYDEVAVHRHLVAQKAPLQQWPVKLALLAPQAPFLQGSDLVLAADCAAFAHSSFHEDLAGDRPLAIGCPKLDDPNLAFQRLTAILAEADIRSITVLRMEVPCCGGLEQLAHAAARHAGVQIPIRSETVYIGPAFQGMRPSGGCPSTGGSPAPQPLSV